MDSKELPIYRGECPHCRRKGFFYEPRQRYYGSPVRICSNCKQMYLDVRHREAAVDGMEEDYLSTKKGLFLFLMGMIYCIVCSVIVILEIHFSGKYHLAPAFLAPMGIVMAVAGAVDTIRIMTGAKEKKMKKIIAESEKRLEDKNYARLLMQQGYEVPEKYLE